MNNPFEKLSTPEYSEFIYKSRYSRWLDEKGRRENWDETVARYVGFWQDKYPNIDDSVFGEMYNAIYNLEVMPSMRALMTAGPALDRDNTAGYNCAFIAIDDQRAFDEILYILCCGTGAGFSVERQYINKLPHVAEKFYKTETVIIPHDSKIGWASAYRELISLLYAGKIPKWDFSKIRPAGARLKTFGGRASGPEPLKGLFEFTIDIFKRASGRKLTSVECHDIICKIAEIVVCGGVRRSALISLSNLSDNRMSTAKSGQWWIDNPQRALANNSVCYTEKPEISTFLQEWLNLYESKSGERGIFNNEAALKLMPERRYNLGHYEFGCNPCSFISSQMLLTADGYKTFKELNGKDVDIVNNNGTITKGRVWEVGERPIVEVKFWNKHVDSIFCTPNHVFQLQNGAECEAKDLKGHRINPYYNIKKDFNTRDFFAGFIQGDGQTTDLLNSTKKRIAVNLGKNDNDIADILDAPEYNTRWYSEEAAEIALEYKLKPVTLPYRDLPDIKISSDFLSGIYSANGSVIVSAKRVTLKSSCLALVEQVSQLLAKDYNISSYITTNKSKEVEFKNGIYTCKESYDLNIARHTDIVKFANNISFGQKYKQEKLERIILDSAPVVSTIKPAGRDIVYDFSEPETHWGVVNGCIVHNSEIVLRHSGQFCNLTEVIVRPNDSLETLKSKIRIASIIGTFQSSLTDFRYLRQQWKDNCEEERLLGVSLTGIMDHEVLNGSYIFDDKDYVEGEPNIVNWLQEMKQIAIDTNLEWSEQLGINQATAITCVKPSGCQVKNSLVVTDSGMLSLEELGDINGEEWQNHDILVSDGKNFKKSTKFYKNGFSKTIKFTLSSGIELESTPNHKYKIWNGTSLEWKEARLLTMEDILPYTTNTYPEITEYKKLKKIKKPYWNCKDISQPKELTEDLAWLLGLYTGDGSTHAKGIRIASNIGELPTLNLAMEIGKEIFDINGIIYKRTKCEKNADLYFNSTFLLAWLKENKLIKEHSKDVNIPRIVRQSKRSVVEAFIDGYFEADGCTKNNGERVFTTISKTMAQQLAVLIRSLGRRTSIYIMKPTDSSYGTNDRYMVHELKGWQGDWSKDTKFNKVFKQLNDTNNTYLLPDKIVAIEETLNDTYDIEVPENNQYTSMSYISHNTVSQLTDTASGIHPRYAPFYTRTVRADVKDPLAKLMIDNGVPNEPDVMKPDNTVVFSFPVRAPEGSVFRDDRTAIEQLELWKIYQLNYCEHKPSITVYVKEHEWVTVAAWVYENFDIMSGVSFLPHSNHSYRQAPYQEIDEKQYLEDLKKVVHPNWNDLNKYELDDQTTGIKELACTGGMCEI